MDPGGYLFRVHGVGFYLGVNDSRVFSLNLGFNPTITVTLYISL